MSTFMSKVSVVNSSALLTCLISSCELFAAEVYKNENKQIELLGEMHSRYYVSSEPDETGNENYAFFTVKGETNPYEQLKLYGAYEYGLWLNGVDEKNHSGTRLAYFGLDYDSKISVDYGISEGVLYDIAAWTDVLPVFGNDTYSEDDNFMAGRGKNLLTLRSNGLLGLKDGLKFAVQFQGENTGAKDVLQQNGQGIGYSVNYTTEYGFSVGAVYLHSDRTYAQRKYTANDSSYAEFWGASVKYDDSELYLAVNWGESHNMTAINDQVVARKTKNIETVAQYQLNSGLRPSIAWIKSIADTNEHRNFNRVNYIDLAVLYSFSEELTLYSEYKINLLNKKSDILDAYQLSSEDVAIIGVSYVF